MISTEPAPGSETSVRLEIARPRWRDLRSVAMVQKESFRPGLAYGLGALAVLWLMPGVTFLVARGDDSQILGSVISDRYRGDVRILNIAVTPMFRRRGVATSLLRAVAAAHPDDDIVLMAEEQNDGALLLYAREGFVRSGIEANAYGSMRHGITMRKSRSRNDGDRETRNHRRML